MIECIKHDSSFSELEDMCIDLSPFAVQIRYPSNYFHITDIQAKKALEDAKRIIDFVSKKVA